MVFVYTALHVLWIAFKLFIFAAFCKRNVYLNIPSSFLQAITNCQLEGMSKAGQSSFAASGNSCINLYLVLFLKVIPHVLIIKYIICFIVILIFCWAGKLCLQERRQNVSEYMYLTNKSSIWRHWNFKLKLKTSLNLWRILSIWNGQWPRKQMKQMVLMILLHLPLRLKKIILHKIIFPQTTCWNPLFDHFP